MAAEDRELYGCGGGGVGDSRTRQPSNTKIVTSPFLSSPPLLPSPCPYLSLSLSGLVSSWVSLYHQILCLSAGSRRWLFLNSGIFLFLHLLSHKQRLTSTLISNSSFLGESALASSEMGRTYLWGIGWEGTPGGANGSWTARPRGHPGRPQQKRDSKL